MRPALPPPAWLRTFEAAARLGGFAAAGAELGLTPAAVSQQIRALEARLGFALFRRLPKGVALTDIGQAYLPSIRNAFDDLTLATAALFGVGQPRTVTIRSPLSFAALQLAPLLAEFQSAYPEIPVRLCTSVWAETLAAGACDLDIRYGDGHWPVPEAIRLTDPVSIPVCPPGTEFGADPAATLGMLARRSAIHIMGYESFWATLAREHALGADAPVSTLSADSSLVALEMVAAGLGVAIVARDLAAAHRAAGRVTAPPGIEVAHNQAHYVILAPGQPARPEALLFRTFLVNRFAG